MVGSGDTVLAIFRRHRFRRMCYEARKYERSKDRKQMTSRLRRRMVFYTEARETRM
jgi:hypothetical protein